MKFSYRYISTLNAHEPTGTLNSEAAIPDVGADVHLAALQGRVHGEVDGVGGLAAVILMDQHRVLRDVKAGGVPVQSKQNGRCVSG